MHSGAGVVAKMGHYNYNNKYTNSVNIASGDTVSGLGQDSTTPHNVLSIGSRLYINIDQEVGHRQHSGEKGWKNTDRSEESIM